MVFYLHCNRTEQGICQFYLYAHNFTAIQILHSDDGLYKLTRQFSESVKQSPKTEVLNLYEGLEDIGVNDFERIMLKDPGHWRISHINKDFQVTHIILKCTKMLGLSNVSICYCGTCKCQ